MQMEYSTAPANWAEGQVNTYIYYKATIDYFRRKKFKEKLNLLFKRLRNITIEI